LYNSNGLDPESLILFKKNIMPASLKKGDKVALIAPGSPIKPEKFQIAITNIESLGLVPRYTDTVFKKYGYLAGTDQERIDDFHKMVADPSVKAIWCLRGGYGCTRLLHQLDFALIKNNPKIIIGYSDITALLLAIYQKTRIIGFHGPVAISDEFSAYSKQNIENILFKRDVNNYKIWYQPQTDPKYKDLTYIINQGKASGQLIGGNLSLLVNLPGTEFAPRYKDKLVFIEEVGEKPYRIDRMLTYLLAATDLKDAAGIILGVFVDCESKDDDSLTLQQVLTDRLSILRIPCFYGFTFGHVRDICTFPLGIRAQMDTSDLSVTLLEQAVK
jgi:muramoyltetrapeptide carboxypeptidase